MPAPAIAAAAGVLCVPVLAITVFLGSGAADPPPTGAVCSIAVPEAGADPPPAPGPGRPATPAPNGTLALPGQQPAPPALPGPVPGAPATITRAVDLTGEQADNARVIVTATKALGMPQRAAAVALMTARQESGLRNLANPTVVGSDSYPHQGTGSDRDSLGVFQQRPSQGWGTVPQLMDPAYAARAFLQSLAAVPGWEAMAAWEAAQAVQASADGTAYQQWTGLGTALAAALWDGAAGALPCAAGGTAVTGAGGAFAPEVCSVVPDPTNGRGCLTPRMANVAVQLMAQGWNISCWDEHAWNPRSLHPQGRACDVFPGPGGVLPTAAEKARGDALAASLEASAAQTGISYLIWYGQQKAVGGAPEPWRRYNGGGAYDPNSVSGGHFDHLHIDVN